MYYLCAMAVLSLISLMLYVFYKVTKMSTFLKRNFVTFYMEMIVLVYLSASMNLYRFRHYGNMAFDLCSFISALLALFCSCYHINYVYRVLR